MDENNKQILKVYNFDVPDSWYSNTDLWVFDLPEALGAIGQCIHDHEQWAYLDPLLRSLALEKWEDLPTEVINDCRQQIINFNKIAAQEIGKLTLLDNGEIGKLQSVMFRFRTDEERLAVAGYEDTVVHMGDQLLLTADIVVDMGDGTSYYIDNAYGIRWIDRECALMPSFEMSSLSREMQQFIHREKTKIVSMEEWREKKKKKKSLTNHPE